MSEGTPIDAEPAPSLLTVTHVVYALHAVSVLIGITTAATIVGAFVFGVPSIIAVVINYLKRGEARGTFLDRTFAGRFGRFGLRSLVSDRRVFVVTFIGIPLAGGDFFGAGLWVIYGCSRLLALRDRKPMYITLEPRIRFVFPNRISDRGRVDSVQNRKPVLSQVEGSKILVL